MDTAEDVVQEFFYHFWKRQGKLHFEVFFERLPVRSIRNNALRYLEHLAIRKGYAEMILSDFRDVMRQLDKRMST